MTEFPEDIIAKQMYDSGTMPNAKVAPNQRAIPALSANPTAAEITARVEAITGVRAYTPRKVGRPSKHGKRAAQQRQTEINRIIRRANGLPARGAIPMWVHDPSRSPPTYRAKSRATKGKYAVHNQVIMSRVQDAEQNPHRVTATQCKRETEIYKEEQEDKA